MKIITHIVITVMSLLAGSLTLYADKPDVSAQELRAMIVDNPDSVLAILDQMDAGVIVALPDYERSLLRGISYNEKRMFSLVERYAKEALASDSIENHPKDKLNALTLLSTAQTFSGNFNNSIQTSIQGIKVAREIGNLPGELNILTTVAKTAFAMGDRKQGYAYLDQAISAGKERDDARVLANVSAAYGVKIVELYADNRFEEGMKEGFRRLEVIDRIDKAGGAPDGFTDQQRAYAFARLASCAQRMGRFEEAKKAYDSFISTDYACHPMGRAYIMDYLLDSKQWGKVIEFTVPLFPILEKGDTINDDYRSLLISRAQAFAGLGDYRKAYELSERTSVIKDSLQSREHTA